MLYPDDARRQVLPDDELTTRQVARLLKVSPMRIRQLKDQDDPDRPGMKRLQGQFIDGKWFFLRSEVLRFMAIPRPGGPPTANLSYEERRQRRHRQSDYSRRAS